MRWITVTFESTASTHSTGAMRFVSAPMMISTMRSGRSRKPTLQLSMPFSDRARVSLNGIVRETVLVLKPRVEERSLTLTLELDPELPQVRVDPDRMKQVVLNLVENAIKFTDPASAIRIRTGRVGEKLRISVRNSAPELASGDLTRIFDRFVQRDGTFARAHGGVGLGLNLVRAIVELHGGRVWGELPEPGLVDFIAELPLLAG